jgi:GrpB-like predicted nucleotidyltransferase (UPF0157 family)
VRREDPIVIVPSDPSWPAAFERERARLEPVLAPALVRPLEHLGSTAVPGLAAKPIIDMLAVVGDVDEVAVLVPLVVGLGWCGAPEPGDVDGRRRSLCFPSVAQRTHHLHVVEERSDGWRGWLAFRDRLRSDPVAAEEYASLKRDLALRHGADPDDRAAYRAGKADFIRRNTAAALEGGGSR